MLGKLGSMLGKLGTERIASMAKSVGENAAFGVVDWTHAGLKTMVTGLNVVEMLVEASLTQVEAACLFSVCVRWFRRLMQWALRVCCARSYALSYSLGLVPFVFFCLDFFCLCCVFCSFSTPAVGRLVS